MDNRRLIDESDEIKDLLGMAYSQDPTDVDKVKTKTLVQQLAKKNEDLKTEVRDMERVIEQLKSGRFALGEVSGNETNTLRRELAELSEDNAKLKQES
jgi:predicted RNase H-like nuclease (RuvC/YqgF family)